MTTITPGYDTGFRTDIPGFKVRRTSRGVGVVEVDFFADPAKRAREWIEAQQRLINSRARFLREYCRDWTSAEGQPYYPEFAEKPQIYIRPVTMGTLPWLPLCRGWDFGFHYPACVWCMYSPMSDRLWVIREVQGLDMDTHTFRDLVKYLSGQAPLSSLETRPQALRWVMDHKDDPKYPEIPFFDWGGDDGLAHPLPFLDFCGPEALQARAEVAHEDSARTALEILWAGGIEVYHFYTRVAARDEVFRRLMMLKPDGHPGLFMDPSCKFLIRGFSGGIVFAAPTKAQPVTDEPQKDKTYSHTHEALGYAAVNCAPAVEKVIQRMEIYQDPFSLEKRVVDPNQLALNEVRHDRWEGYNPGDDGGVAARTAGKQNPVQDPWV